MWGLCGGPDAPHAALSVSAVNAESRGVGIKQSQLSVSSHIVQVRPTDFHLRCIKSGQEAEESVGVFSSMFR